MPIAAGTKLGPYEILSPVGAGGMGEVYRAKDTRLDREVAIKVLPSELSSDPDLRARFEREARAISALNHPNICTLYDVGRQDGTDYLVMELLEGESLAERLAKGALPVDQVLAHGQQIADALEKAHRSGIVHRDLKPGNIVLARSGAKLLDFGLAKPRPAALSGAITRTTPVAPITERGTVVGTFQYMSPEQVEGEEADARSDIFALGAVLYEMLTGKRAFEGKSRLSVASAILEKDPEPISRSQPMTPPALEHVVQTCLAKDPEERFQTAHDVRLQLKWIAEGGSSIVGVPAAKSARRRHREWLAWGLAALAVGLALALAWQVWLASKPLPVQRTEIPSPAKTKFVTTSMAISPDGSKLAFVVRKENGELSLWVRPLDSLSAQELAGTVGATYPFWSPDSRFLAFFAEGKLKKIEASGGAVMTLCEAPNGRGGSWSSQGVILFAPSPSGGLFQVAEDGGTSTELWTTAKNSSDRFPWFLPDGKSFLFYYEDKDLNDRVSKQPADKVSGIYAMRLGDKAPKLLVQGDTAGAYTESGHLLYIRENTLLASRFDASAQKITGPPTPLAERVASDPNRQVGAFAVSQRGQLVYSADLANSGSALDWFDRTGKKLETLAAQAGYRNPRLSPSGERIAFSLPTAQGSGASIWVRDVQRGTQSRLSFAENEDNYSPAWSPDGKQIVYSSKQGAVIKAATGLGAEELLPDTHARDYPQEWTGDGSEILLLRFATGLPHLFVYSLKDKKSRELDPTKFFEANGRFSPDGKWIAFQATDTGRAEIYVMPYPKLDGKWQISVNGGVQPLWRRDGKELVFVDFDGNIMSVEIKSFEPFTAGNPASLFTSRIIATRASPTEYDISADGKRFLINSRIEDVQEVPLVLVNNWQAGLKK